MTIWSQQFVWEGPRPVVTSHPTGSRREWKEPTERIDKRKENISKWELAFGALWDASTYLVYSCGASLPAPAGSQRLIHFLLLPVWGFVLWTPPTPGPLTLLGMLTFGFFYICSTFWSLSERVSFDDVWRSEGAVVPHATQRRTHSNKSSHIHCTKTTGIDGVLTLSIANPACFWLLGGDRQKMTTPRHSF